MNAAQLAVAPDAAQHRLARHPVGVRRAGEPVCSTAFAGESATMEDDEFKQSRDLVPSGGLGAAA